jgi:hypothetical protein
MDIRRQLIGFCDKILQDPHVTPTHIALYLAIFLEFLIQENSNELNIDRDILMNRAKISGRATYNKCMHELNDYGYIKYTPSFSSFLGSMVYLIQL